MEHFSSVTFGDAELQRQVLEIFEQQARQFKGEIAQDLNSERLVEMLHQFKGSARGVGAMLLGDLLEYAEREAWLGNPIDPAGLTAGVDRVLEQVYALRVSA